MEKFNIEGIVIKTSVTGESDKILWILTRNRGIIRAFAKGARGTKSRLHSGASLFAFCDFAVYEKNDVICVMPYVHIIDDRMWLASGNNGTHRRNDNADTYPSICFQHYG